MSPKKGALGRFFVFFSFLGPADDDGLPVPYHYRGLCRALCGDDVRGLDALGLGGGGDGGYLLVDIELYVIALAYLVFYPQGDSNVLPLYGLEHGLVGSGA